MFIELFDGRLMSKGKSATLKFRVSDEVKRMAISKLPRLTATRHVRLPRATVTCGCR